ncbi:helix-turn-helix transcriptional regulator [Actinotalea sp. M2MS4P-6]|uniref:helix-turn-helix transcriptional regulator n=1 Tax=Actinotalea sp. M2MS4P-6 TaxID=2983762 RepID=UPI002961EFC8|nr:AAA family ATPase [Actinotalea sp. M2MS4P-6]
MARGMTDFVAREAPVARLTDALADAARGVPGIVLLGADAGVGKTRLLQHVAGLAEHDGATAITVQCVDLGEVGLPYLPFAQAIGELARRGDALEPVQRARPALARLTPGSGPDGDAPGADDAARLQLFDGIAAALGAAGGPGHPLLLVIEDVHWADSSTRDVLRFLASRLRDEHLLVVASYRADDLHRRHPLRPLLAELWRNPRVDRLDLPAFDVDELRRFAVAVQGGPVADSVVRQVMARSEGNAYFAQELLEAGAGGELPWSLADVLHARLERLDPAVLRLARVAAVAGRQVREPLLRAVWAEVGAGDFDALVHEAVAAQVLAQDGATLAFRHALLAEVVEADLLPGERLVLDQAYLRALLADPTLGSAARLAEHARRAHDLPTAVRAATMAADEAAALFAPAEELDHLEQLLRLAELVPGVDRVGVADRAAAAANRAGRTERAVELARFAVAQADGDPGRQAPLRGRLSQYLLVVEDHSVVAEADRALADLPADAPAADRAWLLAIHARVSLNVDLDEQAARSAQAAVELARSAGVPAAEADASATLAVLGVDDPDTATALLDTAVRRAREAGDLVTEQRCAYNLATTFYYAGRLDESAAVLEAGLARAEAAGLGWSEFGLSQRFFQRLVRYAQGDLRAPDSARPYGTPWQEIALAAVDLYAATARGDDDVLDAAAALEEYWDRDAQIALITGGTNADALTWSGRPREAVEVAESMLERLSRVWDDFFLGGIWLAALALAALADIAAADRLTGADSALTVRHGDRLLERARTTAERGRPRGGRLGPEGRAWLARAEAEHSRLSGRDDPEVWRAATEAFGYGYRYEEARSRFRWAGALVAAGDRVAATAQLRAAADAAEQMGAAPLLGACRDLARRARLDLPGAGRPAVDVLTDREAEVLALVAEGLSNRQIGERLFISAKTVSVHVSNLIAKLGVGGRTEAVTVAHRRGLLDPPA